MLRFCCHPLNRLFAPSLQLSHRREARACVARGAASTVKLQVPFSTQFGETLAIVRSPDWEKPTSLEWTDGDVWTGEVKAEAGPLEYKYVILRAGDIGEWQPGANMMVDVPSEAATLYVDDRWLGEDRSLRVESEPASLKSSKAATPAVLTPSPPQIEEESEEAGGVHSGASHKTSFEDTARYEGDSSSKAAHSSAVKVLRPKAEDGLHKMTVVRLRQILKSYKMRSTGKKTELVSRLRKHLSR